MWIKPRATYIPDGEEFTSAFAKKRPKILILDDSDEDSGESTQDPEEMLEEEEEIPVPVTPKKRAPRKKTDLVAKDTPKKVVQKPRARPSTAAPKPPRVKKPSVNPGVMRLLKQKEKFEGKTGVTGVDIGSENFAGARAELATGEIKDVLYTSLKTYRAVTIPVNGSEDEIRVDKNFTGPVAFEYASISRQVIQEHPELFNKESVIAVEQQIVRQINGSNRKAERCGACGRLKVAEEDDDEVNRNTDMPIITAGMLGAADILGFENELVVPANIKNRYDPFRTEKSHAINKKRVVEIVEPLLTDGEMALVNRAFEQKRAVLRALGKSPASARTHDIYDAILIAWWVIEAITGRDVVGERRKELGYPEEGEEIEPDFGAF